ncbi:hypothetical protein FOA43_003308 [Brettanomyces nanus]|uniref:Telomerase reverse transcriptase n=1 Tax=Eeniella nana TaxID=13502 RepID=A0A875S7L4_EENNA|nr:uncharacterized protein FOA43_003308 [Brettanomyces nanus]QPG75922.1 hypothetical protein FOA43_003308 [Brettanomyces nanus]
MRLREYVESFVDLPLEDLITGSLYQEALRIFDAVILVPSSDPRKIPRNIQFAAEYEDHEKFIDTIVAYLMNEDQQDVLTCGYIDGGQLLNVSSPFVCPGVNFSIQLLKSPAFKAIRHIVPGAQGFLQLLFNYDGYMGVNGLKLWGPLHDYKYKHVKNDSRTVSYRDMLYQEPATLKGRGPLPETARECLREIFPDEIQVEKKAPKRFRKITKILKTVMINHTKKQYEYPYILESVCGNASVQGDDFLKMATSKKFVVRFVLIIVDKVFPLEHIGSSSNKAVLFTKIAEFLHVSLREKVDVKNLVRGLKIDEICWLKPRADVRMTKPEFLRAQSMLEKYLKWFFGRFISGLAGSFFHVTEGSQKSIMLFYRHKVWTSISNRFKGRYFVKHLDKSLESTNSLKSFFENDDFVAKLKFLPKPKGFRLIAPPFKGISQEHFSYMEYEKDYMQPILSVLQAVRAKNDGCISSVSNLIIKVSQFKKRLVSEFGSFPKFYGLKFDVKSAYDSVPLDLAKRVVRQQLNSYSETESIVVRQFQTLDEKNVVTSRKRRKVMSAQVETLESVEELACRNDKPSVEKTHPIVLTKSEIIRFVDDQLSKMAVVYHGITYKRKIGLFQGFNLSGILFDMVYDTVLDYIKKATHTDTDAHTGVFRLVDDFLVLSTDEQVIHRFRKLICRPIHEFNLNINRLKTDCSDESLTFVALDISLKDISFLKPVDSYISNPVNLPSFAALYKRLMYSFEIRFKSPIFAFAHNEIHAIRENVHHLIKAQTLRFISSYRLIKKRDCFVPELFHSFLNDMFGSIQKKLPFPKLALEEDDLKQDVYALLRSNRVL